MSQNKNAVRIGLKLSQDAPIESFRAVWQIADDAGFDHCWAFDHLVTLDASGKARTVFEGWTLLGAMAAATKRTRIGLLVGGMIYRHPALLAKQAVTVDHLSGGRLEFGIGAGWAPIEHEMYGIGSVDHPARRLSEGLRVVTMLWTQDQSSFEGRYYRLRNAVANPKPIQQPHPPIWVGAGGPRILRIAARYADVWNPAGEGLAAAKAAGQQLRALCEEIGRDPAEIRWSTQLSFDGSDPAVLVEEMQRWHEAGFTEFIVYCSGSEPVQEATFAADYVLPRARQLR